MQPLINRSAINFEHYFSSYNDVYNGLSEALKNYIDTRFLRFKTEGNFKTLGLLFNIIKISNTPEYNEIRDSIFLEILKNSKILLNNTLEKLEIIFKREGELVFYRCANTHQALTADKIVEIIESLHTISTLTNDSLTILEDLPEYDNGGKDALESYKKNPDRIGKHLLDYQEDELKSEDLFNPYLPQIVEEDTFLKKVFTYEELIATVTKYLSSFDENHRLPMKVYFNFFDKINECEESIPLQHVLIKLATLSTSQDEKQETIYTLADLNELFEEAIKIYNKVGIEVLKAFCIKNISLDKVLSGLRLILALFEDFKNARSVFVPLDQFVKRTIGIEQLIQELEELLPKFNHHQIDEEKNIEKILERFKNDPNVTYTLADKDLEIIAHQYATIQGFCDDWKEFRMGELVNLKDEIRLQKEKSPDDLLKLVAIVRLALRIKFQIYLHSTQVLTVLGLLRYEKGCIAQVKTGEGKSFIVALLAFVLDQDVHIISSSQNLAIRDQQKMKSFFETFGIKTAHICHEDYEDNDYKSQILYGTASDFEFAVMREMFNFKSLFKSPASLDNIKRFPNLIIDETDNLTIDTANNAARLSHKAEITYEWVYRPIFEYVNSTFNADNYNQEILRNNIPQLKIFLNNYLGGKLKDQTHMLTDEQLFKWLQSGCKACFERHENHDYIIKSEPTFNGKMKKQVKIVDAENTGRIQHGMRWSEGIHEFLEVKHHLLPEQETLNPISISHPVFYKNEYRRIFGLTGTMGGGEEREVIKEVYDLDSFDVPTYQPPQRIDHSILVLPTNTLYLETIVKKIQTFKLQGRPILVLCKTIHESRNISKLLNEKNIPHEMLNELQEKDEEEVLANAGRSGAITIATNTAGRGTDIKIDKESLAHGGLHVLLTFYPESKRVEDQARGRAGRQGEPGSSEMIICFENLKLNHLNINPNNHKQVVEYLEAKRFEKAQSLKQEQILHAQLERYIFTFVKQFYYQLKTFEDIYNNPKLLNYYANSLNDRKISAKHYVDEKVLNYKDQIFLGDLLKLLTSETKASQWVKLLKQVGLKIKNKILNDWSLITYKKMQDLVRNTDFNEALGLKEMVIIIGEGLDNNNVDINFQILEMKLEEMRISKFSRLQKELEGLYNEFQKQREKYFDPSGAFLMDYIREIAQVKLNIKPFEA